MAHYAWDLGINWNSVPLANSGSVEMPYGFVHVSEQNPAGNLASPLDQSVTQGDTLTIRFFNITGILETPSAPPSLQLSNGGLLASMVLSTQTVSSPFDNSTTATTHPLVIGEPTTGESAVFGSSLPMWQCQTFPIENAGWFNLFFNVEVLNPSSNTGIFQKAFIVDPEMVVGAQSPPTYEKS